MGAKVEWLQEHVHELQITIEEAKVKKIMANAELFEIIKKLK